MKLVRSWLNSLIELDSSPLELARVLTGRGFLVDSFETVAWKGRSIVVGKVMSVTKHPSADKLIVCEVDVGRSTLSIVCGATNVVKGMAVPTALPGSVLPGGGKIDATTIRGVRSEGMLCSALELEISPDGERILQLPENLQPGAPLNEALGLDDTVLEVEVPHDRADCLSVMGLAREIAAAGIGNLRRKEDIRLLGQLDFLVRVEDEEGCPIYAAGIVMDAKVQASPYWMQRRLELSGMRAINNVVDVTNYCLIERGQPIHAFDMKKISGGIVVRRAREGERIKTLDGVLRELSHEVLVIADHEKPVAIAGIMGGEESQVKETTRNILIESAYFGREMVRNGSKLLGISSEASLRFRRGVDPEGVVAALCYVKDMMGEIKAGIPSEGVSVTGSGPKRKSLSLHIGRLGALLGISPGVTEAVRILESLGFSPETEQDGVRVSVPSFRYDIDEEADLIEEVARSHGYESILSTLGNVSGSPGRKNEGNELNRRVREIMVGLGFVETLTNCLVDEESLRAFGFERGSAVRVLNPISSGLSSLRPTLLCGMLQTFKKNLRRGARSIRVFELGKLFLKRTSGPPDERFSLCFGLTGERFPTAWDDSRAEVDSFDARGVVEALCSELRVDTCMTLCYDRKGFRKGSSCGFSIQGVEVCFLGEIEAHLVDSTRGIYVGELDVGRILSARGRVDEYLEPPRFPGIRRDISIVVDKGVKESEIAELIHRSSGDSLREVRLFDLYEGRGIPQGKKSLAYSLYFRSNERTLSDEEATLEVDRIVKALQAGKRATLRTMSSS